VSSQINSDGKKINDSHMIKKSISLTRRLEKKYNITIATEQKGRLTEKKSIEEITHEHLEYGKHSLSGVLRLIILEALNTKPTNEKEFDFALLQHKCKRKVYEMDGTGIGHLFHLIHFDETTETNIVDRGVKGSQLDMAFSYEAILMQLQINDRTKKHHLKNVMGRVFSVVNKIQEPIQLSLFETELKKKGIQISTKRKQTGEESGSIYGLIFKDMHTGISFSATDLKLKTNDFLTKIIDDNTFSTQKISLKTEDSKKIDKANRANDKIISDKIYSTYSIFSSLFSKYNPIEEEQIDLDIKKRKRKKRF
jgi:hypothetical protein